jgi:hypothetical protein
MAQQQRTPLQNVMMLVGGAAMIAASVWFVTSRGKGEPADERDLCAIVERANSAYEAADGNEIQQNRVVAARATDIARFGHVANWRATVDAIESSTKGAIVAVKLTCGDIGVGTWNNFVSDTTDKTIISTSSPLYSVIAGLQKGSTVRFTGAFLPSKDSGIAETSVTTSGSMRAPDFIFRFEGVSAE